MFVNILIGVLIIIALTRDGKLSVAPRWHKLGLTFIAVGCFADAYCIGHTSSMGFCPFEKFKIFEYLKEVGVLMLALYYAYLLTRVRSRNYGEGTRNKGRNEFKS